MNNTSRIRLNAFDKDSSANYSKTIEVSGLTDFTEQETTFAGEVPFSRFYFDHEFLDGDEGLFNQLVEL
jgi:hypothetical protein